jgi:hypothetical protein
MTRGAGVARWVVLAALAAGAAPLAAQVPADTAAEPVVVELRVGRLASRTVAAYRVRSEALVPVTQLLQLAEVLFRLSPDGRLEATLDPGNRRLVIDPARDTMAFGERRVRMEPPDFRRFADGELYVSAERLGDLLGLQLHVDWVELTVSVMDPVTLPIARRARRDAARAAFQRRGEGLPADVRLGLERPGWDGLVFDYSVLAPMRAPLESGAYSAALGADALGGALQLGVRSVGPIDDGHGRLEGSWTGVWHHPALAQVRLGTGVGTGPRLRAEHGFLVTNAPFVRPSLVGAVPFGGRLEPGWSIEAYRGGQLVALDSSDALGGFVVELPVGYGENPVDFVAYGPFGEIRQFNRTYRVLEELLPAGRFEYGVSGGACVDVTCAAVGNVDLRYGVGNRWTVEAGADRLWRDSLPDLLHPYAAVTGSPWNAWGVVLEGVGDGFARAGVRYEPSLALRVAGQMTRYTRGVAVPVITPAGRRSQWSLNGFLRPSPEAGYVFFDALVEGVETDVGSTLRARVGASALTPLARLLPYARIEREAPAGGAATTRSYVGLNTFILPQAQWGPLLGAVALRGTVELERVAGVTSAAVFAGRDVARDVRFEAGVTWSRGGGATLLLTLASHLPSVRSLTTVDVPSGGPASAAQLVQGSLLWDRTRQRLATAPGPSLQRAGIAGRVFHDQNADGRWNPGEPGLPGVRVLLGTIAVTTDDDGFYRAWDLIPFEPVTVRVDSLTLDSPLLVPGFATASVVPGPNRFRSVDVPIATAGVLEGRVVRGENGAGARRGVGGIGLVLTNRRTGVARRFATFTDGDFYLLGVTAGDYELRVDERSLEALALRADPLALTLAPTADGLGRSGVVLVLRPAP